MGVEIGYARAVSDIRTTNPDYPFGTPEDPGSIGLDQLDLNFLLFKPSGWAAPYFTVGIGTTIFSTDIPMVTTDAQWRFAWNLGLGVEVYPGTSRRFVFRVDGRVRGVDTYRAVGGGGVYCDGWGYCYGYASTVYTSGEATAGLGVRF
jgi:opacity protein-like surface antigen